jgi:hypothetical protein
MTNRPLKLKLGTEVPGLDGQVKRSRNRRFESETKNVTLYGWGYRYFRVSPAKGLSVWREKN